MAMRPEGQTGRPAEEAQQGGVLRRQALRPALQRCNAPAALGLLGRLQRETHAARQVRPQQRQYPCAQGLRRHTYISRTQGTDWHPPVLQSQR